jgi:nicotinamidase-related amidase
MCSFSKSLLPRSALVIVDVQNDFIDGTLALSKCAAKQDGAEVVPVINNLLDSVPFDSVVYTLDWHPEDHCSFVENVHKRKISSNSSVSIMLTVIY